jgi:hypothetical protein
MGETEVEVEVSLLVFVSAVPVCTMAAIDDRSAADRGGGRVRVAEAEAEVEVEVEETPAVTPPVAD